MSPHTAAIIDANRNRACEGIRVIEDWFRFKRHTPSLVDQLSTLRHSISQEQLNQPDELLSRDTRHDSRAAEEPPTRESATSLITANAKRVGEALRVLEEVTGNATFNQFRYRWYELEKIAVLMAQKKPLSLPGTYLISDQVDVLLQGIEWGVSLIQLRDKSATKRDLLPKAKTLAEAAKNSATLFIVNDYIDIAQLSDADGFHCGQDDLPVSELRQVLGDHKWIGKTTHSLDQGLAAQSDGADYVSVGPIWETPSKPERDGIGFDYLSVASESLSIPYVAIGGVSHQNIQQILAHRPPLIGLIRDYKQIPQIQSLMNDPITTH